ncbi:hypothetical protein BJX68DRAFT_270196 [Aspergillus pseudodeflectus]|uniref:Nucleoside phosphorylase domain-containing protein n=1 Tax=Aspergillus pseudodeflectus TaxID=176178 RepID=A0ABR4JTU5_9EURO
MLPTELPGWQSLQALRSRLSGSLARFAKGDDGASGGHSQALQNQAAFFETDLRTLFTTIPMILTIPGECGDDFEGRAGELLVLLDRIVNHDLIAALKALKEKAAPKSSKDITDLHDIAPLGEQYPNICSLLTVLGTSMAKFNLVTDQDVSLFIFPAGQAGDAALKCVAEMNQLLSQIIYDANKQPTSLNPRLPTEDDTSAILDQPTGGYDPVQRRYASVILNTLLGNIRQRHCGKLHEMKLKVSDDWQTGTRDVPLELFLSCCLDQMGWHHAKCSPAQAAVSEARKEGLCAAIQRAKDQGRSIHLFVDKDGLLDISDISPATPLSPTDYATETLEQLLDQKALTRITANDYRSGLLDTKLGAREKAILALGLARCLLEFFDADIELASHSWKAESVFFLRPTQGLKRERILYISLRPLGASSCAGRPTQSYGSIGPGNPILLSFAKLLLEIENGERISMEIHSESRENISLWREMCDIVERVEREGGGNYLKAVEGCLYLHMALRKSKNEQDDLPLADRLRRAIYDQIVRNLEVNVNPQTTKRKRRDSVSELPLSKKLSFASPELRSRYTPVQDPQPRQNGPAGRDDFEVAIVCALPREYDAVYILFDEVWTHDYERTNGDQNIYTHGRIGKFNVVLLVLPGMGKVSAARASTSLRLSYQRLSLVLVTGICGGVPFTGGDEVLLGDVIISRHVVQYDLGRQYPDEFEVKDTVEDNLGRAPPSIRHLLTMLQTLSARERMEELAARYLQKIQQSAARRPRGSHYIYPGAAQDLVFEASYQHKRRLSHSISVKARKKKVHGSSEPYNMSCEEAGCDLSKVIPRERIAQKKHLEQQGRITDAQAPSIFLGTIGSADTVMKSAEERDRIASIYDLVAFEMEGAGLWDETPCIIVKAVCDYADSHKNKNWQDFAAATAASATKALLDFYVKREPAK